MKQNFLYRLVILLVIMVSMTSRVFSTCPPDSTIWYVTVTASSHTIFVSGTCPITVDGGPLVNGDILGVFFTYNTGVQHCGGSIIWNGGSNALAAWPDDTQTSIKDGFSTGETFQWKVFRPSNCLTYNMCSPSSVTYSATQPNQGQFASNGLSQLTSLSLVSQSNLGLTGWVSPASGCNLGYTEQIKVTVHNGGPGPASGFTMAYSINGGTVVSELYTGTAIANGSSITYIFTQTANLNAVMAYNFSVSVTDACSDTATSNNSLTHTVNKTAPPNVTLSGVDTSYCFDPSATYDPIILTGTPAGGSYAGDGVIANDFFMGGSGAMLGCHTISYSYSEASTGCTGIDSIVVCLRPYPVVTFTGLSSPHYCIYDNVPLTGSPAGGTFFGSTYITAQNVFNPLTPGTFNIGYTYTNQYGCSDTSALSNTLVNSLPVVDIVNPHHAYCMSDSSVSLNGTPAGGIFSISGGGTGAIGGTTFHPYLAGAGIYTILYTYTNPSTTCTNTHSINVKVFSLPAVNFSGLATSYCQSTTPVILSGTPAGGAWIGTVQDSIFEPISVGVMNVIYDYTQQDIYFQDTIGCLNSKTMSTVVYALPVVDLGAGLSLYIDGSFQTANPDTVHLNAGNGFTSYHWNNGSSAHSIITTGYGWYSITVTNSNMCAGHDSLFIGATDLKMMGLLSPLPNCQHTGNEPLIAYAINVGTKTLFANANLQVSFEVSLNNSPVVVEQDSIITNLAPGDTLKHIFYSKPSNYHNIHNDGLYTFRVASTYSGNLTNLPDINPYNDTAYVLVKTGPMPHVAGYNVNTQNPDTGIVFDAGSFNIYLWSTAETTETITVTVAGTYTVTVTDEFGCVTSGIFTLNGINDINYSNGDVTIYPNPTDGIFDLFIHTGKLSDIEVCIYNSEGKKVYFEDGKDVIKLERKLDISALPAGVYYLRVDGMPGNLVRKFVKR
ncbi:MAG: T9SS type A sorting domain-containing protein [Bacteroidia bacterium]|nr:T9SS type A sorting domain-containing protein [Bacteroidia bacterium]